MMNKTGVYPVIFALCLGLLANTSLARSVPDPNQRPAPGNDFVKKPDREMNYGPRSNYLLQCSGCHLVDGSGYPAHGVPDMRGFVGNFLRVEGGREYLLQVPGVTQSSLTNRQLAVLLNWLFFDGDKGHTIAGDSSPTSAARFTTDEVARLRGHWVDDLPGLRASLIRRMQQQGVKVEESAAAN